jgi:diaminopimelate decarboxylase
MPRIKAAPDLGNYPERVMNGNAVSLKATQLALNREHAALPEDVLRRHVEGYFLQKQRYLDVAAEHSLPLYILETEILEQRAKLFREAFLRVLPEMRFYFAVKSNNYPEVSRIVLENGFGLDVSSGAELQMALYLGAQDIIFSGPGKTKNELLQAVKSADMTVVLIDSFNELDRLHDVASSLQRTVRAGVRVSNNPTGLWRKFGIHLDDLLKFQERAAKYPYVDLQGIQFHSSWNLDPERQVDFIEKLGGVLSGMPVNFLRDLQFIDIGGGYWPSQGEWLQEAGTTAGMIRKALDVPVNSWDLHYWNPVESIATFANRLAGSIRAYISPLTDCRICVEPGRWICNDAMHLLLSVVDKKADDLVITDAGTNAVGWERFENDYFPILNLTRPAIQENPCTLYGSLCTPHDIWGYSYWGEGLEEGDVLLIPMQGAYTYSLRQDFIKPLPSVIIM